jgi:2-oxoglutarate dehydrogenase E1 component
MLCLWEAQFGDFCNGAQVIIDQFIAASEVKWDRSSGLVMLLPHGYEGQGPEHSSAFLERFLQLCAEDNMQVCNVTTPAQYFHLLRRQMHRGFRKPLIIMSPKSLLRRREAVSPLEHFTTGNFQEALDDPDDYRDAATVILCAGKIYYDLIAGRKESRIPIIRIEQFYPFPGEQLKGFLSRYPAMKEIRWVQEESRNRGGWTFMREHLHAATSLPLTYIGRPSSASPATGSYIHHVKEQERIVEEAFKEENHGRKDHRS